MDWERLIREVLELLGVIQRREDTIKQKLAAVSRRQPSGKVTVLVQEVGEKQISVMTAVRKVTGLSLDDALVFIKMVPAPLLQRVDPETAVLAQEVLEQMGARVKLVGMETAPAQQEKRPQPRQETSEPTMPPKLETPETADPMAAFVPPAASEDAVGSYKVILNSAGLLEERIVDLLQRLTDLDAESAQLAVEAVPITLLEQVNEAKALHIQQELQMYGAVVDVLLEAEERTTEPTTESAPD